MEPYQSQLFSMSMFLIACMFIGTVPAAWLLRDTRNPFVLGGSSVLMFVMILVVSAVAATESPTLIAIASGVFGLSLGATLGTFTQTMSRGRKNGGPAVAITLGLVTVSTIAAAAIGVFSGYNFQALGGILFGLLIILLIATIAMAFFRIGNTTQLAIGAVASLFWVLYLIYDFNMIVHRYSEATWSAAANIAMNVYLDMVNLFIQLLPIILEIMDALD